MNDENTERNDAYAVINLRIGHDGGPYGLLFSPFIGVQNVTNELYNANDPKERFAEAEAVMVWIDIAAGRSRPMPDWVRAVVQP